jgi:hypothetical protein
MSVCHSTADLDRGNGLVSFVPDPDMDIFEIANKEKAAPKAALEFKAGDRGSGSGHQFWL